MNSPVGFLVFQASMIRPEERIEKVNHIRILKPEKPWRTTQSPKTHYGFLTVWFGQLWLEKSCDFLNISPFTPMVKTIKNHTAAVWLVMVLIWVVILLKNWLNFTKCHVFKNVAARKYPWFFVRSLLRHKSNKRPVYAGFPVFRIVFGNVVSPSICAPLPFLPRTLGRGYGPRYLNSLPELPWPGGIYLAQNQ